MAAEILSDGQDILFHIATFNANTLSIRTAIRADHKGSASSPRHNSAPSRFEPVGLHFLTNWG